MTKKERIEKLEKEVEELRKKIEILEMFRVIDVGDTSKPYLPNDYPFPYPTYPYIPTEPFRYPTVTWQGWNHPLNPLYGRTTSGG